MIKIFGMIGALFGAMSVGMGAFGAHALRARVLDGKLEPRMLEVWQTAASYQMYHALAILALFVLCARHAALAEATTTRIAGIAFITGVSLFSGSLYAMVLSGVKALGAITPIGGVAFIIGWLAIAALIVKSL